MRGVSVVSREVVLEGIRRLKRVPRPYTETVPQELPEGSKGSQGHSRVS